MTKEILKLASNGILPVGSTVADKGADVSMDGEESSDASPLGQKIGEISDVKWLLVLNLFIFAITGEVMDIAKLDKGEAREQSQAKLDKGAGAVQGFTIGLELNVKCDCRQVTLCLLALAFHAAPHAVPASNHLPHNLATATTEVVGVPMSSGPVRIFEFGTPCTFAVRGFPLPLCRNVPARLHGSGNKNTRPACSFSL